MQGKAGNAPTTEELILALRNHDLFLYFGHGSGMSLEIQTLCFPLFQILVLFLLRYTN